MAAFRFKVVKRGKIIGEATTYDEAAKAATKERGRVVEIIEPRINPTDRRGNLFGKVVLPEKPATSTVDEATQSARFNRFARRVARSLAARMVQSPQGFVWSPYDGNFAAGFKIGKWYGVAPQDSFTTWTIEARLTPESYDAVRYRLTVASWGLGKPDLIWEKAGHLKKTTFSRSLADEVANRLSEWIEALPAPTAIGPDGYPVRRKYNPKAAAKKIGGKVLQEMGKTSNPGAASGERVGDIILRQLGGTNRLKAMINANNFLFHPDGLEFNFSGPEPQKRGNNVLIRLEPGDTYSAGFIYIAKTSRHWATAIPSRPIHKYTGIYADQLMPLLERHTGLTWSLGSALNSPKTSNPRASNGFAMTAADKKVVDKFTDRLPAESGHLTSDGATLSGNWMGGSGIAVWTGDKIVMGDLGSKSSQTVQSYLRRNTPANWLAKTSNPPLEHSNAAILLDTVKPGKPQVIHGVKVSRVGSGYSIDRVVLSRELAIKRLEAGGKVGNPAMYLSEAPEVSIVSGGHHMAVAAFDDKHPSKFYAKGLMFVGYDPKTLRIAWTEGVPVDPATGRPDSAQMYPEPFALFRDSNGRVNATILEDGKTANPKAKPAAKSKGGASDLDEYRKLEKQRSDAVIAAHRCGAYVRESDGETVCPNSEAQSHMDRARRIGADLDRRFPALTGGPYSNPKTSNPHEDEYIPVQQALSPFATAWFALMKSKGGRQAAQARSLLPLYRDGTVNDRSLFLTTSDADLAKLPAPAAAMARPLAGRASNPPLEHSTAAILLDTVKPGKPQVIHGVKVSRVGAGYSIDRVVLSRELAIKRLEAGGKAKSPRKPNTGAAPRIQTTSGGVPGWPLPAKHLVRIWFDNGKVVEDEVFAFSERDAIAAYAGKSYDDPSLRWPEAGSDPVKVVKVEIAKKANPSARLDGAPPRGVQGRANVRFSARDRRSNAQRVADQLAFAAWQHGLQRDAIMQRFDALPAAEQANRARVALTVIDQFGRERNVPRDWSQLFRDAGTHIATDAEAAKVFDSLTIRDQFAQLHDRYLRDEAALRLFATVAAADFDAGKELARRVLAVFGAPRSRR